MVSSFHSHHHRRRRRRRRCRRIRHHRIGVTIPTIQNVAMAQWQWQLIN